MNTYLAARLVEDRVSTKMSELRQAERDCSPFLLGLNSEFAFDSAEALYRHTLVEGCGLPERDVRDLDARSLRTILRHQPRPGTRSSRAAPMAFDSSEEGNATLDRILSGVPMPRDLGDGLGPLR